MTPMTTLKRFDPARVLFLVRNRVHEESRFLAIALGSILAVNLITVILWKTAVCNTPDSGLWSLCIIVGWFVIAASSFRGMHGRTAVQWILLPATPLEKYLAALVFGLLLYPLLAIALCLGASALLSLAEHLRGETASPVWKPFTAWADLRFWLGCAVQILTVIAAAAVFRKSVLIKWSGVATLYVLVLVILLAMSAYAGISHEFSMSQEGPFRIRLGGIVIDSESEHAVSGVDSQRCVRRLSLVHDLFYYGLLPVFAVLYGLARVREKEARDAVQ